MADEESSSGGVPPDDEPRETVEDIRPRDVRPLEHLPPRDHKAIEGADRKESITLKGFYGRWILWIMAAQLVVVNAVFVVYAWAGYDWCPPDRVVEVWLTATFVQIVGIVVGITRSLFPRKRTDDDE